MASYKSQNDPANPDAVPLYNDSIFKFWNWFDATWNCNDWVMWHKSMKAKYGKEKADATLLKYWDDLANMSFAIDCRSFDSPFRAYMKSEKLLDSLYTGVGALLTPLGAATDAISSVSKGVSGAAKGLESAGKILKIAVPVILVAALGFGGYWAYKKYVK